MLGMKWLRLFLLPVNVMLVDGRLLPAVFCLGFPHNSSIPITVILYPKGGERHCESKVFCPRPIHSVPYPELEPGLLDPGSSTLTTCMRVMHDALTLPKFILYIISVSNLHFPKKLHSHLPIKQFRAKTDSTPRKSTSPALLDRSFLAH